MINLKPPNGPLPDVKQAVRGYAAGYNAYLRKTGVGKLPDPRCRGKAWVKPISVLDVYMRFYQLLGYGSTDPSMAGIAEAQPPLAMTRKNGSAPADEVNPADITTSDFPKGFGTSPAVSARTRSPWARTRSRVAAAFCSATRTSPGMVPSASSSRS